MWNQQEERHTKQVVLFQGSTGCGKSLISSGIIYKHVANNTIINQQVDDNTHPPHNGKGKTSKIILRVYPNEGLKK